MLNSPFRLSVSSLCRTARVLTGGPSLSPVLAATLLFLTVGTDSAHAAIGDQLAKLLATDGAAGDRFGRSVAISGNRAIVGAYFDDVGAHDSGSAYVFDATTGAHLAKLVPDDGGWEDYFGISVAISGNTAIVGSAYTGSGSAYVFDVTTGAQLTKLVPSDGANLDFFGGSVAISGNIAIVSSVGDDDKGDRSGASYLFNVTTGTQLAKLRARDGAPGDDFGTEVAISGNIAVVGALYDDDRGLNSGSAYLFDVTTRTQIRKLLAVDGAAGDYFGGSVSISGNRAIIGAYGDDDLGDSSGSAYLFDVATGTQIAKLRASDGAADDRFGSSVAISGNTAIVGARGHDGSGADSGSAYLFDVTTGAQLARLLASDGAAGDQFGNSVTISATTAVVGASYDDDRGSDSGSAYVFSLVPEPGTGSLLATAAAALLAFRRRR
jgi:hypothetical protein